MSVWLRLLVAAWLCLPLLAGTSIEQAEYKARREELRKVLSDGVLILFGSTEREGGELRNGFFQSEDFYYLTGWTEPGAILVLTPKSDVLLIPRRDPVQERWTGPKAAPGDADIARVTGFETVVESEALETRLAGWLQEGREVYTMLGAPSTEGLRRALPLREVRSASEMIGHLRMKKSPAEIGMIQRSTEIGVAAHLAGWKAARPGVPEYQVAAAMTGVYFGQGCERNAYSPIVGSGPNAAVLHYAKNTRQMDSGELVLMDVGPECSMYATDITRTIPVNGKFTSRQRELYEVVLGAQKSALAAVKPGVMLGNARNKVGLHKIAADYIDSHGKDLHGNRLGKYFIHGLGHHVGLDVHDSADPAMPLAAGMVITLEPGIYIPEEKIGIRIEDVVLVTENGARVLSEGLPREIADIEKTLASR